MKATCFFFFFPYFLFSYTKNITSVAVQSRCVRKMVKRFEFCNRSSVCTLLLNLYCSWVLILVLYLFMDSFSALHCWMIQNIRALVAFKWAVLWILRPNWNVRVSSRPDIGSGVGCFVQIKLDFMSGREIFNVKRRQLYLFSHFVGVMSKEQFVTELQILELYVFDTWVFRTLILFSILWSKFF